MGVMHTLTEGGQISTHKLRMLRQVFKVGMWVASLIWIALLLYRMSQLPTEVYETTWHYVKAYYATALSVERIEVESHLWWKLTGQTLGQGEKVLTQQVMSYMQPYAQYLEATLWHQIERTGWIAGGVLAFIFAFFFLHGRLSSKKQHIAGNYLASVQHVAWSLKFKRRASPIHLGQLPLVKGTETQHILITGGTGSGKTNCLHYLLPQVRRQQQPAIILDTTGAFVDRYYREGIDVLLNPFDARGVPWHPWIECHDNVDYEALAESFIPQTYSGHDHYWNTAARALLSSVLIKLEDTPNIDQLKQWLLFEPLSKLAAFVQGTKAASHLDLSSERTAGSVRSVAASFLGCLEFLNYTDSPFSIRNWVQSSQKGGWLFLSCKPSQRAALNPLLACWLSVAMRSLFLLEPDFKRRLWFVMDELPTLQRLKGLESLLCESRKYGGCACLALQSPAQLEAIYGPEATRTMIGNCGTKIVFVEQDPEIAIRISKAFGEHEIKEYQKGLSYGANDIRDGVNLTLQSKQQPLISPTMIQFLEKNQAFVRLPGNLPVVQIKLKIAKTKGVKRR